MCKRCKPPQFNWMHITSYFYPLPLFLNYHLISALAKNRTNLGHSYCLRPRKFKKKKKKKQTTSMHSILFTNLNVWPLVDSGYSKNESTNPDRQILDVSIVVSYVFKPLNSLHNISLLLYGPYSVKSFPIPWKPFSLFGS